MTDRTDFIDALAEGRRPRGFRADPEDLEVLGVAVELAAQRPGEGVADETFLNDLHRELSGEEPLGATGVGRRRHPRFRMGALVAAAACAAGLSVFVAQNVTNTGSTRSAVTSGATAHVGTFLSVDHSVQGTIVITTGPPSWIFMAVEAPSKDAVVVCRLQNSSGAVVASASLHLRNGTVVWSRSLPVGIEHLSRATLFNTSGKTLAVATIT